jgi:putative DNA primase/helicase
VAAAEARGMSNAYEIDNEVEDEIDPALSAHLDADGFEEEAPDDSLDDAGPSRVRVVDPEAVRSLFARTEKGKVRPCTANVITMLERDPRWDQVIGYDAFREAPVLLRQPPQRRIDAVTIAPGGALTEQDVTRIATWMLDQYGVDVKGPAVVEAVMAVGQRHVHHPVCVYLDGLRWDGEPRVDDFFARYCRVAPTSYASGVARLMFLSAVARVRKPGCKVDTIPILEGPQGALKSTMIRALASDAWFADTPIPLDNKDAYQQLRGVWIYEIGELASFKGKDASRIKSFASSGVDTYRPSFERRSRPVPRQCIFIGTTNDEQYLVDATGGRRFLPVRIVRILVDAIRRDRDQLWAEAAFRFAEGESWWPGPELARASALEQEDRYEGDPWEDPVRAWLARPVEVHVTADGKRESAPLDPADGFTMSEVLLYAIGVPLERQGKEPQGRMAKILHRAGWKRGNRRRVPGNPTEREYRWLKREPEDGLGPQAGDTTQLPDTST